MSDANRMSMGYVEEVTWGVVPSGPPTLKDVRFTGESLKQATDTAISDELRDDRQVPDFNRTSIQAEGDVNVELSYKAHDDWLQYGLQSAAWTAEVAVDTADTAISAAAGDNSFNHTTAWSNNPTANQWIKVSGFATAANNGYFKVVSVTSTKIVVSGGTLATEAAGPSVTIKQGGQILNGTTFKSISLEKEFTDLTNEFVYYTGLAVDQFSYTVPQNGYVTGAFTFLGKNETGAAATIGDGSPTAAPTNRVMQSVDHVVKLLENQAAFAFTQFSFQAQNNLRALMEPGNLGPTELGSGEIAVSGTLQAYFKTKAAMDKYRNFTDTSLAIIFQDAAGNGYVFEFVKVNFGDGQQVAGGKNTDIIADLSWQAIRDSTENVTTRFTRFDA